MAKNDVKFLENKRNEGNKSYYLNFFLFLVCEKQKNEKKSGKTWNSKLFGSKKIKTMRERIWKRKKLFKK